MKYVDGARFDAVVIGLGHVGFPAALLLADAGLKVCGYDASAEKVQMLRKGISFSNEQQINQLFSRIAKTDNFKIEDDMPVADAYIIAVPTPLHSRKKSADLDAVIQSCYSIKEVLRKNALVIIESTISPMTCREIIVPILEESGLQVGKDVFLSHCPERLFPGDTIKELQENDRIIGGMCAESNRRSEEIYRKFVKTGFFHTDDVTAEFIKLIENTYRDVNIALANELYLVADKFNISITQAIELANHHPRVNLLKPGIGVGGHCIPIDPWFIAEVAPEETVVIPAARRVNDRMPSVIARKVRRLVAKLDKPRIGAYGVTYKPDVADQRESPAHAVIKELKADGYQVDIYDPIIDPKPASDFFKFLKDKDALLILVEHAEIKKILKERRKEVEKTMRHPLIIDYQKLNL